MIWTPEHSILLAKEICGYEVQTSPKGVHYVIEDGRTRPLPDFPNDPGETLTTLEAWLKVNPGTRADLQIGSQYSFCVLLRNEVPVSADASPVLAAAICWALWRAKTHEAGK